MSKNIIILGLDIGGANTKAALIKCTNSEIIESYSYIEYFPFWEQTIENLPQLFERIITNFVNKHDYTINDIYVTAVTITAELSDAFQTKREGINKILHALSFDVISKIIKHDTHHTALPSTGKLSLSFVIAKLHSLFARSSFADSR